MELCINSMENHATVMVDYDSPMGGEHSIS